ncbi:hypothetical protein D3C86_2152960 [compost metagenome]
MPMVLMAATLMGSRAASMASAVVRALMTMGPPGRALEQLSQSVPFHWRTVRKRAALLPGACPLRPLTASSR